MQVEDRTNPKLNPNFPRLKRKQSNLNDVNCGRTPTFDDAERIVGGEDTEPFEYPWNVALTLQWGLQFCGGSLINKWVSINLKQLMKINLYINLIFRKSIELFCHFISVRPNSSALRRLGKGCVENEIADR